jgi:hypothetical protein
MKHEAFQSLEAVAEQALKASAAGRDAFIALSMFDMSGSRKKDNAISARSLWAVLDYAKPKGPYGTKANALVALGQFVRMLELPEPLLVDSGREFHVYWPMDTELPPGRWKELDFRLKAATAALGFAVDTDSPANISSILRVPGTTNYISEPVQVKVASWGDGPCAPEVLCRNCAQLAASEVKKEPGDGLVPFADESFEVVPGQGLIQLVPSRTEGEPPARVLVNKNEFYQVEIQSDTYKGHPHLFMFYVVKTEGKPARKVEFSISKNYSGSKLTKWLGDNGLQPVSPEYNKVMLDFLGRYIASLQDKMFVFERMCSFGWGHYKDQSSGKEQEGFTVGWTMYTASGDRKVALDERCKRMAQLEYVPAGTLAEWKEVPELYGALKQPEGQLFMCAAFAAPFVKFKKSSAINLIMNLWDKGGGQGKALLVQAVNSVWGHPSALASAKKITTSACCRELGIRRNLPYWIDGLTTMKAKKLSSLLDQIANGREKLKSKLGGADFADTASWDTVTFLASNQSTYEMLSSRSKQTFPEIKNVVDIPFRFENCSGTEAGRMIGRVQRVLGSNYGLAGPEFMRRLFEGRPDAFKWPNEYALAWDNRVRQSVEERFWTCGLGLVLAAGRLASEYGLLGYDMDALESWVKDELLTSLRRKPSPR